ncbi:MAG: 30S ribosomal protein S9 [Candidatus Melainabacteria bacterium GWF2_37_15]|nr:MAG: 30S ribosomal protein S9 [Candidatus Melainabacteria bacterium GWF2_37_15]
MTTKEYRGTGRRKTAIARVKLVPGKGKLIINNRTGKDYFGNLPTMEMTVYRPLVLTQKEKEYDIKVSVIGGGISAQAGAIKHGVARALVLMNEENREVLRTEGLLTRDPRVKERKKYGQKRARKRFQFSKR